MTQKPNPPNFAQQLWLAQLIGYEDTAALTQRIQAQHTAEYVAQTAQPLPALTVNALLQPLANGKYLHQSAKFWLALPQIKAELEKAGVQSALHSLLLSPLPGGNVNDTLLHYAERQRELLKNIFVADLWRGELQAFEDIYYRTRPESRTQHKGIALRRDIANLSNKTIREDAYEAAGLKHDDLVNILKREFFETTDAKALHALDAKMQAKGQRIEKEDFLMPCLTHFDDSIGEGVFLFAAAWSNFKSIHAFLESRGERLSRDDLLRHTGDGLSAFELCLSRDVLYFLFVPEYWVGYPEEVTDLWQLIPASKRADVLALDGRPFDFASFLQKVEDLTFAKGLDLNNISKAYLFQPMQTVQSKGGQRREPLALPAVWQKMDQIAVALAARGEKITLADLRQNIGHKPINYLLVAANSNNFDKVLSLLQQSGEALRTADLLLPQADGQTVIASLGHEEKLEMVFRPQLWVGRSTELRQLWAGVPAPYQAQVDFPAVLAQVNMLTLRTLPRSGLHDLFEP